MKAALEFVTSMEFWRMAVLWAFYLLISYWKLFLQPNSNSNSRPSNSSPWTSPSGFRPVCVITGATSGLGAAAAHALSARGFFVVLVGRSSHLLAKTIMDIKTQNENVHLKAFEVDVASFHSLLQFKASLQQWLSNSEMHPSIQLLINNAGILATSSRLTSQGYDQMMATNYLSAFSLSKLLLPLLRNSPVPSRIVNVTSFTHRSVLNIQINKDTVSGKCFSRQKQYPFAHVYECSKLFLLLFSYELHRQRGLTDISRQVSVIAVDPGVVETNIMREVPSCLSGLAFIVLKLLGLLQSPEIGVSSILDAALSPPETSGVYYFGGKGRTVDSSVLSYNAKLGEELWDASTHLFLESQLASKETFTSE
ncbi:dehydrogenase/reductase SDR family member on chromosome X-like isoform X1 [Pyrus x bretschneideri]|uniref:dehydrogenase/reductase SDR family member on chromosome X-like isoform X1 n=1 Tax=Pyrus x bretschneideri TaxID=225117 RepID=UPI00202DCF84|nr:dehydrogenase/reductase SDR family member on chromosome X-like isoform X1 [Pyrus x bretschneideri]